MKTFLTAVLFVFNVLAGSVTAEVELFPAGDFEAKSSGVSGYMVKKGGKLYLGQPLKVRTDSFKTGIDLRDEHTHNYMSSKGKHPVIVINKGMGKDGKGIALLSMNGKSQKINFEYEEEGSSIKAKFTIKISDFGIEGISYKGIGVEDEVAITAVIPKK